MKTTSIFVAMVIVTTHAAIGADMKNWPKWMQPKQSKSAISTPANPTKTMDCSQCTSTTVVVKRDLVAGKPAHGFRYVTQTVHRCDGCRDTLARSSGTKTMELTHNCTATGENTRCCATNRVATHGLT
jgi:hypothetical protein